jgi:hypothetical protein
MPLFAALAPSAAASLMIGNASREASPFAREDSMDAPSTFSALDREGDLSLISSIRRIRFA